MIKPGDEPIPGYRVEQLLGRGQFGQVWRARSPGNTTVALKIIELIGAHGWKEFRAIQRVKQIRHAHLMPIVAIWLLDDQGEVISDDAIESIAASHQETVGGRPSDETLVPQAIETTRRPATLIVATLLANQTLGDRLKECQAEGRTGIPIDELLNYMEETAKGLDFLNSSQHTIGQSVGAVQHCDVKPDNIMLTGGSVVIADFGVAQTLALSRHDATATSLGGTPAYMAPEIFVNKPSKTSDQYSLAITYYELRTGRLPFAEQTYAAVYQAHREGTLDFSAAKPAEQPVLRKATSTDPDSRFGSCADFAEALAHSLQPKAMPAEHAPPGRRRLVAGAVVGILLAATAIAFAAFHSIKKTPPPPMSHLTVVVDPPDADVIIDGKPVKLDAAGNYVTDRQVGQTVLIRASKAPERLDGELKVETHEGEQRHELKLSFSAAHFAEQADQLAKAGPTDDAVTALAEAIKLEPDRYARLPEPIVVKAATAAISGMRLSDSGRVMAIAARDGSLRRWAIDGEMIASSGQTIHRHGGEVQSMVTTDGWTASISDADPGVLITSDAGKSLTLQIPEDTGSLKQLAIAANGASLVAVSEVLDLLPPVRRAWTLHAWDLTSQDVAGSYKLVQRKDDEFEPLLAAAHHEASAVLAATDGDRWRLRKIGLTGGELAPAIHEQAGDIKAIAVSADDRRIAVGGGLLSAEEDLADFKATLIDAPSGRAQALRRGHPDAISALAFDAAGDELAIGDVEGDAQVWNLPSDWNAAEALKSEAVFLNDRSAATSEIACPRRGWVVCNYEGKVVLWDCQPGSPQSLQLTAADDGATTMACTPDGRWIVTGHEDGSVRFWPVDRLILLQRACAATGQAPRGPSASHDQTTRCDPPSRPSRDSLEETVENASRRWHRPSAVLVG